jgi:hypothetical protein
MSRSKKFNIREWNEKYLYESAYTHPQDIVKARDFSDFVQNMEDNGWEFKNFPSSKKSALDKFADDAEIAYDQLTGVKNYQDFENFVVHYLSNGKEDWYIYVDSEFKNAQASKGSPKFRNIGV